MNLNEEQIENMKRWQKSNMLHSYTCLKDGDEKHVQHEFTKINSLLSYDDYISKEKERGVNFPEAEFTETELIPTESGWKCPVCSYIQPYDY